MLHVNHPWEFKGEDSEGHTLVVTDESVNLLLPLKCVLNLLTSEKMFLFWQTKLRVMLGLESPEATGEDKEWETLINETTYSKNDDKDLKFR